MKLFLEVNLPPSLLKTETLATAIRANGAKWTDYEAGTLTTTAKLRYDVYVYITAEVWFSSNSSSDMYDFNKHAHRQASTIVLYLFNN